MADTKRKIAIIGGGIIGSTTAYYLSRHPKRLNASITIFESSNIAAGASGKAGGFLARDWHYGVTKKLGKLSFDLHAELAEQHNGLEKWDYRRLATYSVGIKPTKKVESSNKRSILTEECDYIAPHMVTSCQSLGTTATTAQVTPYKFTNAMVELANDIQVIQGHVTNIDENQKILTYTSTDMGEESDHTFSYDDVVICAGPWSPLLVNNLPIAASKVESIIYSKDVSPCALFTDIQYHHSSNTESLPSHPEIYPRSNGEVYICGNSIEVPISMLPRYAKDVHPDLNKCANLHQMASLISPPLSEIRPSVEQACILPMAQQPIIGKLKPHMYVASGHAVWGICLAPATGKCLAELILDGKMSTLDLSMLGVA